MLKNFGKVLKQDWDIKLIKDNPVFPFIIVDNWYTPTEEVAIWKELDFLSSLPKENMKRAENTIVARDADGESKSKAYRFYIEDYYMKRNISPILNCMYKQITPQFKKVMEQMQPYGRSFRSTNRDTSMVSYYEENDHYRPHFDSFTFTCLIWMVREPRLFTGGDFKLNEPDIEIRLRNNRMVMFPCSYLHSVSPIKFRTTPPSVGYGKYTITHFYYTIPSGDSEKNEAIQST